jgi:hypothetical protein
MQKTLWVKKSEQYVDGTDIDRDFIILDINEQLEMKNDDFTQASIDKVMARMWNDECDGVIQGDRFFIRK